MLRYFRYIPLIFNLIDSLVSCLLALIVFVIVVAVAFIACWVLIDVLWPSVSAVSIIILPASTQSQTGLLPNRLDNLYHSFPIGSRLGYEYRHHDRSGTAHQ
jgi:hypothetical protein